MSTILAIATIIYAAGVAFGTVVALKLLADADCDHAFIIILGWAIPLVLLWPIALPVMAVQSFKEGGQ